MSQSVEEELEVLSAIYSDNEEFTLGTGSWGSKMVTIRCSSIALMITLPRGYPKSAVPLVNVKKVAGEVKKKLSEQKIGVLEEELRNLLAEWSEAVEREVCCYNVIAHAKEFVEHNEQEQKDLFSAMKERERERESDAMRNHAMESQVVEIDLSREEEDQEDAFDYEKDEAVANNITSPDKDGMIEGVEDEIESKDGRDNIFTGLDSQSRFGGSRYTSEFDEIAMIGSGGYGKVFKCRNRLDGRIYAVKKCGVATSDVGVFKKIRREVTTISRLLHGNIVRYYAAWLEDGGLAEGDDSTAGMSSFDGLDVDSELLLGTSINDLSSGFMFERDSDDEDDGEDDDDDAHGGLNVGLSLSDSNAPSSRRKRTLFILMEYCEGTLREAIDKGKLSMENVLSLFRQLLDALNFVHSNGLIHRDIKPSNVLLRDQSIRLGDFGLAVAQAAGGEDSSSQGQQTLDKCSITDTSESLTGGIGTQLYCAPEQLNSLETQRSDGAPAYNAAVDIFSCGIVLFELLHGPFVTTSERIFVIRELREKRHFDKEFLERSELESYRELILSMIDLDPKQRPTAHDLLESPLLPMTIFTRQSQSTVIDPSKFYALAHDSLRGATIPRSARQSSGRGEAVFISPQEVLVNLQAYLESLFQLRGAVEMKSPSLSIKARDVNTPDSTMLLSGAGNVLHLPIEPLETWATFLNETPSLQSVMHYEITKVFVPQKGSGLEHPQYQISVLYDCLAPITSSELVDFDVLSAAWSLADMLARSATTSNICFYLTDWRLLRCVTDVLLLRQKGRTTGVGSLTRDRETVISRLLKEGQGSDKERVHGDAQDPIDSVLRRLELLVESLRNVPPVDFLDRLETFFQSILVDKKGAEASAESPVRAKQNIEVAIAGIGTKKKRPSNENVLTVATDLKASSQDEAIAAARESLKRKFTACVFHLRNALQNLEYCSPSDESTVAKVRLEVKLAIPGKAAAEFGNQDGLCFSVESVADPAKRVRNSPRSCSGLQGSKGRVLVYGGHFERLLRSRRGLGSSSSSAMIVHHHAVSFLVNRNTFEQRGAPRVSMGAEMLSRRTLFSSCLDVLVVYKSRDHAYGAEQSRICAVLAGLRKMHIRCSFNTNQLVSGPVTLESRDGQSAAGKAINVAELRRLHSLRVPFVVVLTPKNTGFVKVYSKDKDLSGVETVALADLPAYIASSLQAQQEVRQSPTESYPSNESPTDTSPRAPSSIEARLIFSPGVFSPKDPNKEVFRRRQVIKERLASFLQSLFGGGTVGLSIDDSPNITGPKPERTSGFGPVIFASQTDVGNLQYFHGIATKKGIKQLNLEDFSEEARLDKRHWLKALVNFVKSKKGVVFLYSIPSDDLVFMECG